MVNVLISSSLLWLGPYSISCCYSTIFNLTIMSEYIFHERRWDVYAEGCSGVLGISCDILIQISKVGDP